VLWCLRLSRGRAGVVLLSCRERFSRCAPWFPAAPTGAVVCRCTPHAAASFNAMYQTGVADAHPHRAVQRDCRRALSSLSRGGRWTTASSVPYPVLSAIVMTMFTSSSMPPSLSVAVDAVASLAICDVAVHCWRAALEFVCSHQ
jgi:hypothetical protein